MTVSKITVLLIGAAALLAGCERPPVQTQQNGYRGTGMLQVNNPRILARTAAAQTVPAMDGPAPSDGPKAGATYQNLKVLGDLSVAEFNRTMVAITSWVAPAEGCAYCHNLTNLADDGKYTKVVARRMVQMTQHLNADWKNHTGATGVTCYTCHRGAPLPAYVWFKGDPRGQVSLMLNNDTGQNRASPAVGLTSLPYDPFDEYLADNKAIPDIRINGPTALPTGKQQSIKQAEHTYGLMIHIAGALGVNCTYCHNTRSFQSWDAPPPRATAWYGIRMVGDLNANFLTPLTATFPPYRLGPTGDSAKINCATCHQGVNKPLAGAQMAKNYPALLTAAAAATPAAPAPAASVAQAQAAGPKSSATVVATAGAGHAAETFAAR